MAEENSTQKFIAVDEAAMYLEACDDTFGQVFAILSVVEKELPAHGNLRNLVGAANSLVRSIQCSISNWQEEIRS